MKQCTITLWDQLLSLYNLLHGLHLQSPTRSKPISWLERARNKIERLSDSRSRCNSPVILLSDTDLKIYMENTEQYIVPKIIFMFCFFFFLKLTKEILMKLQCSQVQILQILINGTAEYWSKSILKSCIKTECFTRFMITRGFFLSTTSFKCKFGVQLSKCFLIILHF